MIGEYKVLWETTIEADDAHNAAEQALEIQRDFDSVATRFRVVDKFDWITDVDLRDDSWRTLVGSELANLEYAIWDEGYTLEDLGIKGRNGLAEFCVKYARANLGDILDYLNGEDGDVDD